MASSPPSSLGHVLHHGLNQTLTFLYFGSKQFLHFVVPKFVWSDDDTGDEEDGNQFYAAASSYYYPPHLFLQNKTDALFERFDVNHDGHISSSELFNMTGELWNSISSLHPLLSKYHDAAAAFGSSSSSSSMRGDSHFMSRWLRFVSREWPLLDWKIGVFVWKTFGGLLLVLALLSVVPGRLHRFAARLLRWPVLGLTYFLVGVELGVYIVIRLFIRIAEYVVARPKHRKLRYQMSRAKSYREWYQYASELDRSQKRDVWLQSPTTVGTKNHNTNDNTGYFYNWPFILELMKDMRLARKQGDSLLALAVIQQCTRKNVGGVMNEDLFSYSNTGEPKSIVREFIQETVTTLKWITDEAVQLMDDCEDNCDGNCGDHHDSKDHVQDLKGGRDNHDHHYQAMTTMDRRRYDEKFQQNVRGEKDKLWKLLVDLMSPGDDGGGGGGSSVGGSAGANSTNGSGHKRNGSGATSSSSSSSSSISELSAPGSTKNNNGNNHHDSNNQKDKTNGSSSVSSPAAKAAIAKIAPPSPARPLPSFHREQVLNFLKRARAVYGRTALCLSGGAMLGLYHFGVVKALHSEGLLPHIISGTSAGSVVGAILCTRTDEELKEILKPEVLVHKLVCFSRPWKDRIFNGILKTGNMFLEEDWIKLIRWFTLGETTFLEAYRRTGKIFCITLSSTSKKSPPVLLNYLSAPNVVIASAVIASAAVPGFISPVRLRVKDKDGVIRYQGGGKDVDETFWDGSIQADLPVKGLSDMLNCQFFIASQCNPHIAPFFFNPKGGVGMPSRWTTVTKDGDVPWRGGFLLAALEMYLKTDMKAKMCFLNDVEAAVGFTSTMMTQDFVGSTTIVPRTSFVDFFKLFTNPTLDELERFFQEGAVAAYGHFPMISLHYSIADALDECIAKLESGKRLSEVMRMARSGSSGGDGNGASSFVAELLRGTKIERDAAASDFGEDSDYEEF